MKKMRCRALSRLSADTMIFDIYFLRLRYDDGPSSTEVITAFTEYNYITQCRPRVKRLADIENGRWPYMSTYTLMLTAAKLFMMLAGCGFY